MTVLLIGPVLVALAGAAALSAGRPNAPRTAAAAVAASALHLLCACVVLGRVWAAGPLDAALLSVDRVNGVLWVLVAGMGVVVTAYSRTYLADDEGQARFTAWLSWTLAAVTGIVLAGHLVLLFAAWTITSFTMHRLLRFFPDRPAAELAARKKFVVSRLGDLSLLAAGWWLWQATGSLDIDVVQAGARAVAADGAASWHWHAAGIALAVAAIFKSAQFPVHGWLLEVMETPTPVSALLHAGVINAGGILLIRSSDVLMVAPIAGDLLVLIGGMTAIVGSLVMLTQTSIKVALAYSTVAQMGFMLLQCGLGAFAAATLHIVAHSCYKAHAFLSSGSVVALAQSSWLPTRLMRPHPWRAVIATAVLAMLALASATWFSERLWLRPEMLALAAIVAMGVTLLMAQSLDAAPNRRVLLRITAMGAAVVGVYVGLQAAVGVAFRSRTSP